MGIVHGMVTLHVDGYMTPYCTGMARSFKPRTQLRGTLGMHHISLRASTFQLRSHLAPSRCDATGPGILWRSKCCKMTALCRSMSCRRCCSRATASWQPAAVLDNQLSLSESYIARVDITCHTLITRTTHGALATSNRITSSTWPSRPRRMSGLSWAWVQAASVAWPHACRRSMMMPV